MLRPGTRIGPYEVVEHVGAEGTMAEVYRAVDQTGRTVALKLLREAGQQARLEAQTAVGLDHPGIVRTYEVRKWEGRLCLVQEWVEGQSLRALLDSVECLDLSEAVKVGSAVASALAYAHGLGILHRDIKPSNVLRTAGGDYKLLDFGATAVLDPVTGQTARLEIAGTPLYMSPEQALGQPQATASDIYGLGLLLFECVYGRVPGGYSKNYLDLLVGRAREPIDVPPSPLQGLLVRCLDRDPALRPQSAWQVLEALSRIVAPPPVFPAQQYPGASYPQQGFPSPPPRAVSRSSMRGPLAAGLVVTVGFVLASLLAPDPADVGFWLRLVAGLVTVGAALLVARWVRRLTSRAPETERQAESILTGAGGRDALTRSMVIEVDQVVAKLKTLDAKFLGLTMVMLIEEAEKARESADRVAALVQMVTLMEKLMKQLSPWHVRHKEAIATVIAIVGSLVGVASVVSGFLR